MPLKKHHKYIIGSLSTLLVVYMIINGMFVYLLFIQQKSEFNALKSEISTLQADTQAKINELTTNILTTQENLGQTINTLNIQVDQLKASTSADFSGIIEDSLEAVVTIKTDVAQGTGFIINEEGYIVTNAHVLSGARKINAITSHQELISAEVIGYSELLDLALIKIPGTYSFLELDNSDDVQVGEKVIAIGNPLGLQFSVSEGIVSGIHRPGINELNAYIQTDAALNPGNSGGPLINKKGKAIGMNNFKIGDSENLGFALESNYIRDFANEIATKALNQTLI